MEALLSIYKKPYDPKFPVVCMDETTKQCVSEIVEPMALAAGHGIRHDYEYKRNGVGHLMVFYEPLVGQVSISVKGDHARRQWVSSVRDLMNTKYRDAAKVTFVLDNLVTHNPKFFYEFLPAPEAEALLKRMDFKFTPKHASWLNIAEIAINSLQNQCLARRIGDIGELCSEVEAWVDQTNSKELKTNWTFTTSKARVKLRRLYPSI